MFCWWRALSGSCGGLCQGCQKPEEQLSSLGGQEQMEAAQGTAASPQPCCHIRLLSCLEPASMEDHLKRKINTINCLCQCPFQAKSRSLAVRRFEHRPGSVRTSCAGSLVPVLACVRAVSQTVMEENQFAGEKPVVARQPSSSTLMFSCT